MPSVIWLDYEGNFGKLVFCGKSWTKSFRKNVFMTIYSSSFILKHRQSQKKQFYVAIFMYSSEPNYQKKYAIKQSTTVCCFTRGGQRHFRKGGSTYCLLWTIGGFQVNFAKHLPENEKVFGGKKGDVLSPRQCISFVSRSVKATCCFQLYIIEGTFCILFSFYKAV